MKVLLTGATGYIGRRLLPVLVNDGHHVVCAVRDKRRFDWQDFDEKFLSHVTVVEVDLEKEETLKNLPPDLDAAYYLVHSMTASYAGFAELEQKCAKNFSQHLKGSSLKQIIYLSGIVNDEALSEHLQSRKDVEEVLKQSGIPVTVLRAAIIIGSGSASFEIIRDLVEKLPVMIAPKWLKSKCQPIAVRNVVEYLSGTLLLKSTYNQAFDIGGPDILSYKQMLLIYANVRNLRRRIISVPVLSPKLSSLWLYFVTSTSFSLARNLIDSMRHDVVVKQGNLDKLLIIERFSYTEALEMTFSKISQKNVISSWKDAINNLNFDTNFLDFVEVPSHGCFKDTQRIAFSRPVQEVKDNIWSIGGTKGWYFGGSLWKIRGFIDQLFGGVGLRRGRRSPNELKAGDALDFWRVLKADEKKMKLLLYAEMKLPGEAWLEFTIEPQETGEAILVQQATFRPVGLWGRLYWYSVLPFHWLIFPKMARNLIKH